ncbi:disease resistance protein RGA2-like [Dioscorea cayenensis subsp. rotundata]|uniref:Disease resistance protein RGA2-like n=1 Tax=Dioscorea cayennensis subsp. rotundata TaxID=55577 RepID=A0AB40CAQ7_DIOCR|nr:disease resistance protein RGA2-like [Dioscorea cayenensis subsp. rotundata]XP_039136450.1 disease resistance protein RGA2-like [Dioscorea cayenensis subsp. rotundata]XP_039136451.1 disease resistance protein RGA2-like [Dioscorea cayenensis subsp. rotundata]
MNPSTALQLWSRIPWKSGGSSDKRRRLSSSESTDDIVNKMRTITEQINCIDSEMRFEIKLDALKGGYNLCGQHQVAENKRVTTSSPTESKIYGRDYEFSQLIQLLLKEPNVSGNVSVIPIVGMGGIGKTTLAQFAFNNIEIANHFEKKAWICVSDFFDRFRITKEILDSLIDEGSSSIVTTSCDVLEREIKRLVTGKKFLLVLDDVWSNEWRELLNFLRFAPAEVIKLVLTCRDPKISGVLADRQNQITLKGLSAEDYWLFFMKCAFADENPDNYLPQLRDIGKQIVGKLKGSPLAAKTVGKLLGISLTEGHWKDILGTDLWNLETDAHGITSALALSYYHLCQPLQLCFTFCSVFPKDFVYDMHNIIDMWIAHGYIQEIEGGSKTLEDIGEDYWHELIARGFFEQGSYRSFKMHDLLHDLALSVSHGKTYIYKGQKDEEIPKDVCHLCVHSFCDLELVCKTSNLRTLVLYGASDIHAILNHKAFKRIRVLVIFSTNVQELPDDVAHLKHLQYLDLEKINIISIPESLCRLYLLRVLKLLCSPPRLPSQFQRLEAVRLDGCRNWARLPAAIGLLPSLKKLTLKKIENMTIEGDDSVTEIYPSLQSVDSEQATLSFEGTSATTAATIASSSSSSLTTTWHCKWFPRLENLHVYKCDRVSGFPWPMLAALDKLETLNIEGLKIETSDIEAQQHQYLLPNMRDIQIRCCQNMAFLRAVLLGVSSLESLFIGNCTSVRLPALGHLSSLGSISLQRVEVTVDDITPVFLSLHTLKLEQASMIFQNISLVDDITPVFQSLHTLELRKASMIFENISSSPSSSSSVMTQNHNHFPKLTSLTLYQSKVNGLHLFSALEHLKIIYGHVLDGLPLPNLQYMRIQFCEDMETLPVWLPRLPLLNHLYIGGCSKFRSWGTEEEIKEDGLSLPNLQIMEIHSCKNLETLPAWLPHLLLLKKLIISSCPKFRCWDTEEEIIEDKLPLPNLQYMRIELCKDLETLPVWLPRLPLLNELTIRMCPKFKSWGIEEEIIENGLLLPNLRELDVDSCEDL